MKLESVETGMLVVAKETTEYKGLVGEITQIDKNNDDYFFIIRFLKTEKMNKSHPQLNFRRLDNIGLEETEIIFFPKTWLFKGYDSEGKGYAFDEVRCHYDGYYELINDHYIPY